MIKYVVWLTEDERSSLMALIDQGKAAARKIKHANVLLKMDAERLNWSVVPSVFRLPRECSHATCFSSC